MKNRSSSGGQRRNILFLLIGIILLLAACGRSTVPEKAAPERLLTEILPEETTAALTEMTTVPETTTEPETTTVPETTTETETTTGPETTTVPDRLSPGSRYVLNTNTGKFHEPSCSSVKTIKPYNRQDTDADRDAIIAEGYVPCKKCNP